MAGRTRPTTAGRPALVVSPLSGALFGAEVSGLDLAGGVADRTIRELWAANISHGGLLVIRGQDRLPDEPAAFHSFAQRMCSCASGERAEEARSRLAQKAFAEGKQLFGASDVWVPGFPDIRRIGNLHEFEGHENTKHVLNRVGRQWHLDGHKGAEPLLSFILGVVPGAHF